MKSASVWAYVVSPNIYGFRISLVSCPYGALSRFVWPSLSRFGLNLFTGDRPAGPNPILFEPSLGLDFWPKSPKKVIKKMNIYF